MCAHIAECPHVGISCWLATHCPMIPDTEFSYVGPIAGPFSLYPPQSKPYNAENEERYGYSCSYFR